MKVLTFTSLFPNAFQPNFCGFVARRLESWAEKHATEWAIVAPVPFFPKLPIPTPWSIHSLVPGREKRGRWHVLHPRYFMVPRLGDRFQGASMALMSMPAIRRLWRESGPFDLIDAHFVYPDGYAALLIGRRLGVPVTVTARGSDINLYPDLPAVRGKLCRVLLDADALIGVSQALVDRMQSLGAPAGKCELVANGVNTRAFRPPENGMARPSRKRLLTVGNLVPEKGVDVLIGAARELVQDGEDLELTVVGDGPERRNLEEMARSLDLNGRVRFEGFVIHDALPELFRRFDFFCLASHREGCPNVVLEALASGLPVVATRVGGIPEMIADGQHGILVPPGDSRAFAEGLREAFSRDWDPWKICGAVEERSWERTADAVQRVFQRVTAGKA